MQRSLEAECIFINIAWGLKLYRTFVPVMPLVAGR